MASAFLRNTTKASGWVSRWLSSTSAAKPFVIDPKLIPHLPPASHRGSVILVKGHDTDYLVSELLKEDTIFGFDTESKPSFTKGKSNKLSLVQISGRNHIAIWQLCHFDRFPQGLRSFLEDENRFKIAQGVYGDGADLQKTYGVNTKSMIDLATISRGIGTQPESLQAIVAIFLGKFLQKNEQTSNWGKQELSLSQIRYAATDAWVSREVFLAMAAKTDITPWIEVKDINTMDLKTAFQSCTNQDPNFRISIPMPLCIKDEEIHPISALNELSQVFNLQDMDFRYENGSYKLSFPDFDPNLVLTISNVTRAEAKKQLGNQMCQKIRDWFKIYSVHANADIKQKFIEDLNKELKKPKKLLY